MWSSTQILHSILMLALATSAAAGSLGEGLALQPGETARFEQESLAVTFEGVSRDNRCPRDVQCIVAGEAVVELTVETSGSAPGKLTLKVPGGGSAAGSFEGYTITVTAVDPQTLSRRRIAPEDYVARIVVERSQ